MSRIVGDSTVAKSFIARRLGTTEGRVVCDYCNGGPNFDAKHRELEEEATEPEQANQITAWTETMYAHACLPKGRAFPHIDFDRVYCEECAENEETLRTISTGTRGFDEFVLRIKVRWCGIPGVQPHVFTAEMEDRSHDEEGIEA